MFAGGAKKRAPSNHEVLASQGLQEGPFRRPARADFLICRCLDQLRMSPACRYRDDRCPALNRRSEARNL